MCSGHSAVGMFVVGAVVGVVDEMGTSGMSVTSFARSEYHKYRQNRSHLVKRSHHQRRNPHFVAGEKNHGVVISPVMRTTLFRASDISIALSAINISPPVTSCVSITVATIAFMVCPWIAMQGLVGWTTVLARWSGSSGTKVSTFVTSCRALRDARGGCVVDSSLVHGHSCGQGKFLGTDCGFVGPI